MSKLSAHFTLQELTATSHSGIDNTPPEKAVVALGQICEHILEPLRALAGSALHVNSGYRSPALNTAVGGSATSQHCLGEAADIVCSSKSPLELAWMALDGKLPFDQMIFEGSWLHISHGPKCRGQVLTATFTGGKVKYRSGLPAGPKP